MTFRPQATCGHGRQLGAHHLCANYSAEELDVCGGETGAALSCYDATAESWMVTGLLAWEVQCSRQQKFAVFQALSDFHQWIDETRRRLLKASGTN